MKQQFTIFLFLLIAFANYPMLLAQTADELRQLAASGGKTPAETAVLVGKALLGKPYEAHTLETDGPEELVVNLQTFDCTTFLETTLALALAQHETDKQARNPDKLDASFRKFLTRLRYRNGQISGYASRLHYFSDWMRDNDRKGLLRDISHELPGSMAVAKPVNYMTAKTWKYPSMRDPVVFQQIARTESAVSQQSFYFVPKKNLRLAEQSLRDGDVVMIMASRPGLDMKHCGLAVWQAGRVHLLHASSIANKVMITTQSLTDYVLANRWLSGIRVARLR
jgi:Protein of unknown function (DUF1460)